MLHMRECEYNDVLQNNITKSMNKLITQDDFIDISIDVYDDVKYEGLNQIRKNKMRKE